MMSLGLGFRHVLYLSLGLAIAGGVPAFAVGVTAKGDDGCPTVVSSLRAVLGQTAGGRSLGAGDPQVRVWELRGAGRMEEAKRLEEELAHALHASPIVEREAIGVGLSKPEFVRLENGVQAVWKPLDPVHSLRGSEVAAYEVDRVLGLNVVPVTVERALGDKPGTLQARIVQGIVDKPKEAWPSHLTLFDYLIGNSDRNPGNFLTLADGRVVAIDHGVSFAGRKTYDVRGMFQSPVGRFIQQRSRFKELQERFTQARALGDEEAQAELASEVASAKRGLALQRSRSISEIADVLFHKEAFLRLKDTPDQKWREILGRHLRDDQVEQFIERKDYAVRLVRDVRELFGDDIFPESNRSSLLSPTEHRDH